MSWSPSRIAAIEPTIDASAPSARWVWPRITPGCSSKVRFTRSSNSRMRTIWVYIQISRSRSSSAMGSGHLCAGSAELGGGRLVRPPEDVGHGVLAQLLGEHLDAPRARVSDVAAHLDVAADVELALAGQPAMVDDLVDRVVHVGELAVRQLDPADLPGAEAPEVAG